MKATIVALGTIGLLGTSCLNLSYTRTRVNEPIAEAVSDRIRPGTTSFGEVIAAFGAPTLVWPSENGDIVMAFAWLDLDEWRVSLSYSLQERGSASVSWNDEHAEIPALVVQFDRDLVLRSIRRGLLRDLAPRSETSASAKHTSFG